MKQAMHTLARRLLAMTGALCLLLTTGASAEGTDEFSAMLPLIDLTASAALRVGETPETITPDGTLSEAFVYNFFLLGQQADASLGITGQMLGDISAQAEYMGRAFSAKLPALNGILTFAETYPYIGVRPMASEMSEDATARRSSQLTCRCSASNGWRMYSFSFEAELMMEEAAQNYFADTMVEYMNVDKGFSIQYPAVFAEENLTEDENGIIGALKDGSAAFYARRKANDSGATLDTLMADMQAAAPSATPAVNEAAMSGRLTQQRQDGMTQVDLVIVTDLYIYEAQLVYAPSLAADFALYSDYMTNSFTADELGIG